MANETDARQSDTTLAREILESFNTWKFKREQPKTETRLFETIVSHVRSKTPIQFVMYWGKGEHETIGEKERKAFLYLQEMMRAIAEKCSVGTRVTLVLTDTHAELNGHTKPQIKKYFDSVGTLAKEAGFETVNLSRLADFDEQKLLSKKNGVKINRKLLELLVASSEKHCKRYNPDTGAILYYLQNQIEKKKVEETFPDAIFLTYNGNELDEILPIGLPTFYMYSLEKGTSIKPWFED